MTVAMNPLAWLRRFRRAPGQELPELIDEAYQEYEGLLGDYNNEVAKYNQEIEAWEVRLEEKKRVIVKLVEELGEFWFEPLGIVEDIYIHW